jgi:hypothetical protein
MKTVTITIHNTDSDRTPVREGWQIDLETGNTRLTAGRIIEAIYKIAEEQVCRVSPIAEFEAPKVQSGKKWDGNIEMV